jgi:hypothetical protein
MYRHIPKLVVLSAIGLLVLAVYMTQLRGTSAPAPPSVVYIDQGFGARTPPAK